MPLVKELVLVKATALGRKTLAKWKDKWNKKICGQKLYKLEPKPKSNIVKLFIELKKKLSLLLIQMQTGKLAFDNFSLSKKCPRLKMGAINVSREIRLLSIFY